MTATPSRVGAMATLAGVPAGLTITGGGTDTVLTITLAGWLAVFVLAARRRPLGMLLLIVASVAGWRMSGLIDAGWVWPATAVLVLLVLDGRLRAAAPVAAGALVFGAVWDTTVRDSTADWVFAHLGGETLWVVAVLAGASAYRNTLRWRAEVGHRMARDEQERELEARRRRAEERVEVARDLHDVVSHTLAVVGVHLNVALDAFDTEPDEAKESLKLAQEVRGRAMADLKALVGVLRDGELPQLAGLDALAARVRAAGLTVVLDESGDRAGVPAPVAAVIYRVVQEALTNTVRHAGASAVRVTLRYLAGSVSAEVRDDGNGGGEIVEGHGISGMRERLAALGGSLTVTADEHGFLVRATAPWEIA